MKSDTQKREIDYSFLLKCMAGFAAAAVFTVGVIGLIAAKTGASAGASSFVVSASIFGGLLSGIGSLLAVVAVIAAIACLSPRHTTMGSGPYYRPSSYLYAPGAAFFPGGGYFPQTTSRYNRQVHGYPGTGASAPNGGTHSHPGAGGGAPSNGTHTHPGTGRFPSGAAPTGGFGSVHHHHP